MSVDILVIGGGITGAGVLLECARRGFSALLVERGPTGATTAVSSGLVHGGLRYLPYDAPVTLECCRESGWIVSRYRALLRRQPFLWPLYEGGHGLDTAEALLELYDELQPLKEGRAHVRLGPEEARALVPGLSASRLRGALTFDEWAVDPRALVSALLDEARAAGAKVLRDSVRALEGPGGRVSSALLRDGTRVEARCVINAAGPWAAEVAALAGAKVPLILRKGVHLVLPGYAGRWALLFRDETGRTVGLYPRAGEAWVGPTDDPYEGRPEDAAPSQEELSRLRRAVEGVLPGLPPSPLEGRVGVRPIIAGGPVGWLLSRDYRVLDHGPLDGVEGLVTVTGGKLVLFRKMAEEAVSAAARMLCASTV